MADLATRVLSSTPREVWNAARAIVRGTWWIAYFRLARRDVRISFPFKVRGPVVIEGPGSVSIARGCRVNCNTFRGLSIVTLSPDARVRIGERANLGGLAVRCRTRVTMGARVMTAVSLVQDYLVDDGRPRDDRPGPPEPSSHPARGATTGENAASAPGSGAVPADSRRFAAKPIEIGDNVWLGPQSIVLAGARIGADSVLSAGSVCHDLEVPPYSLMAGNPVRRPLPITQVLKLQGVAP